MVGVGDVSGEYIDLPGEHLLLVIAELVPFLQQVLWPRRHFRIGRDYPELLLVLENLIPKLVPALIEQLQLADLLDPFGRRVVRSVDPAGCVLNEERLLR
jgi:hypothetical protein